VTFGTNAVFVGQIVLALLGGTSILLFMPTLKQESASARGGSAGCQEACKAVRRNCQVLLRVAGFILALQSVRKAREMFFALAGRAVELSDDQIGQVTSLSFIFDMACFPIAGMIMDTYGRRVAGGLSLTILSLGICLLFQGTVAACYLSAILTGAGNGLSSGLVLTLGSDLAPEGNAQGPFLSIYRMFTNVSELIAPAVMGVIARRMSLRLAEITASVSGVFGVLWIITCVPETLPGAQAVCALTRRGSYTAANDIEPEPADVIGNESSDA